MDRKYFMALLPVGCLSAIMEALIYDFVSYVSINVDFS